LLPFPNYFTFFKDGLAFFADIDAPLLADASIAPADCLDTPSLDAIFDCTALKPGCDLFAIVLFDFNCLLF
jgi:hypothetical protein